MLLVVQPGMKLNSKKGSPTCIPLHLAEEKRVFDVKTKMPKPHKKNGS
jgi:hypothetical protein